MKYTLLDLTQTVLSSMDSDEVNSIDDTIESQQVAKVIKTVYFDLVNRANVPEQFNVFQLEAYGDSSKPTLMTIPNTFQSIKNLKYNVATIDDTLLRMEDMVALPLADFLTMMYNQNTDENNVSSFSHVVGTSTITFIYRDDTAPKYYTTFDDYTVVFDSYDADVDSTLQKSKTLAYGKKNIPWTMTDTFTPDLDDSQFPILINEAKSLAFQEAKQTPHPLAERNARRGWVSLQKQKQKIVTATDLAKLPDFGRR